MKHLFRMAACLLVVTAWPGVVTALANAPPAISGPANQTNLGVTTVSVAVVASDPEGASLTYAATGLPAGLSINTTTGVISGTLPNGSATYPVTVSASDGSLFATRTFNWMIALNHVPIISGPPNTTQLAGTKASLSVIASDADGQSLTYGAIGLPDDVTINPITGVISGTVSAGAAGTYNVTLTASDGGLSGSVPFVWHIVDVHATVWDTFTGEEGASLDRHTPDIKPGGATWQHVAGDGSATLRRGAVGITGPLDGTYQIWTLDAGVSDVTLAVDVSSTNVARYGGLVFRVSDANNYFMLRFDGPELYERNGGVLRWIAEGRTPAPMVSGRTYRLEVRMTGSSIKVYWDGVFQFQTSDSFLQSATRFGLMWNPLEDQTALIDNFEVSSPHGIPVITAPLDQTAIEGTFLSVPIAAFDIDGGSLSYGAAGLPPGLSVNAATGIISGTPKPGTQDTYRVTVHASNETGTASRTFYWAVLSPSDRTRIFDTFSGGPLLLSNHLLDAGPSWLRWKWLRGDHIPIVGDGQVHSENASHDEAWGIDVGVSDVTVAADVRSTDATPWGGVVLRETDPNHYLTVLMNSGTESPRLYMRSGDDYFWLASGQASFGPGVSRRLRVRAVGNVIEAYVDGVLQFSATTGFNQTATSHGLIWSPIEDATLTFDDFEVSSDQPIGSISSQLGNQCVSTVSPLTMTVGPEKGTYSLQVWTQPGCDWSFQSETDDIIEEGGRSVDGVTFSIQNNTQIASRTGRLSVADHTVTITQLGLPSSTCTFAVSPGTMTIPVAGGTGQIGVTSQSGCAWTAFSPDAFVHITSGASGSGTGVVAFTFDNNTTQDSRTSVFDVAGRYVTVTQSGIGTGGCYYSIAPTPPLEGGDSSEDIAVTAPIGCPWSATSEADFLQVSGNATGNGSGTVTARASANPNHEERSGTLQVAGQEVTLFQLGSAGEPFCVSSVTPSSVSLPAIGGQGTVVVNASSGCQWSASSGASWLNLVRTNAGSVTYVVGPNAGDERAILVTIGLFELSINQEGATPTGTTGAEIVWPAPRTDKVPDRCFGNCGAGCGTFFGACGGGSGHWTMQTQNEPQLLGNTLREVCSADRKQLGVFPQYAAMVTWTYHGVFSVACWDHDHGCQNQLNPLNWIPIVKSVWCLVSAGPVAPVICDGARPQTWSYSELKRGPPYFPPQSLPIQMRPRVVSHRGERMSGRLSLIFVPILVAFAAAGWIVSVLHAQSATSTSASGIVARVDDIAIDAEDLDRWWQANDPVAFARIRRELYEGRKRAVAALLGERLLETEAKERHLTVDQLIADEAPRRATPPSEAAIKALFESSASAGLPFEQARPIIVDYLAKQASEDARQRYVLELRDSRAARTTITLIDPALDAKATTKDRSAGAAEAPVEIVEFADFQCPFCGKLEPVMKRIMASFGDQVRLVWKDFPLSSIHEYAQVAAVAARCAADQGAFWKYHDLLFNNQDALSVQHLRQYALDISLDTTRFNQCITEPTAQAGVQADLEEGTLRGVEGTPTVFINGEQLSGALDYDDYEKVIVRELARISNRR